LLLLILLMLKTNAQTPIPPRYDGFAFGGPSSAPILLEGFFDVLCPDCAAGWPTINKVIAHYGNQLNFLMHTFPLPYHTNAFIANQAQFWNAATMNMTTFQVIAAMGSLVDMSGIMKGADWITGVNDANLNMDTRISWKYGCSRGVTGTPTFIINGVYTSADDTWTEADWYALIDGLLQQQKEAERMSEYSFVELMQLSNTTCPAGESYCQYTPTKSECCLPGEACIPNVGCRC